MKLEITKERVLEAASKSSTAKSILQTLFPKCFEQEINLYKSECIGGRSLFSSNGNASNSMIALRDHTQFYLSNDFNWELIDNGGFMTLKPKSK